MEFYKNIDKSGNFSTVSGRRVDFSTEDINGIYNLLNVDDQVTQNFLLAPDLNLVEHVLCPFGANWSYKSDAVKGNLYGTNLCYKS